MALQQVEIWDDDDLQGDILHNAPATRKTSMSSRLSFRSESNAGDDDWQVPLTAPQDNQNASKAISSAKLAGIPLPDNVPTSALTGGAIKRLGTKKSQTKVNDDWGEDLDLTPASLGPLKLKPPSQNSHTPSVDLDDLDDWGEGSLGIRNAGTRRQSNPVGSSASAMSPSMRSVKTAGTEDDGFDGLVLPSGPMDFSDALQKRQDSSKKETQDLQIKPDKPISTPTQHTRNSLSEDFLADIDFGAGEVFDPKKRTLNRNIKQSLKPTSTSSPATRTQTTITFTDRAPSTRIPRPVSGIPRPARLEPVMESGPPQLSYRPQRPEPTTTSAQLLRSKRSMPALRSQSSTSRAPPVPFLPSTTSIQQSQHIRSKASNHNLRQDSSLDRVQSPPPRPTSRLSNSLTPDTPTRQRRDVAPSSLTREAANKRTVTKPAKRRNFGDGTELDMFDDLPTSAAKESKFIKQPSSKPSTQKLIRNQPSQSRLGFRDKMVTPLPQTPKSPTKAENLPRFARDTASSRIARESKIGPSPAPAPKPRGEAPLMPRMNWPAHVAARSPHTSPSAQRQTRKGPTLINPMGKENARQFQDEAAKKGMRWNPTLCKWEGNESAVLSFDPTPAPPSPPRRPAVITNVAGAQQAVQVVGGMVFDPQKMCWLKIGAAPSDPRSPSFDDDDDPFRDIEDLKETKEVQESTKASGSHGVSTGSDWLVGEEFDLGPEFIRRQREEEVVWRSRVGAWFGEDREREGTAYVWAIRDIAATVPL